MNYNDTLEWRIKTKLDFAPSSGNYCRIHLAADTNNFLVFRQRLFSSIVSHCQMMLPNCSDNPEL
ncbi:MAG: hypothetical protein IPN61_14380 [Bacteroidetes bacterium]|nr:hypothetical protein [Bacteroidota bacterium]